MKTNFIITCHGSLAKEFKNTLEMIIGPQDNIKVVNFDSTMSVEELYLNLENVYVQGCQNIVFTDIKGGTPFNCAFKLKYTFQDIMIVTGTNIPVLIEIVSGFNLMNMTDVETVKENISTYIEFI